MKTNSILFWCWGFALAVISPAAFAAEEASPEPSAAEVEPHAPLSTTTGSYLSGQFARQNGDIDRAVRSLQRVHDEDPGNKEVSVQLEGMLLLQGKIEDAVALAQDIRQPDAGNSPKDPLADLLLTLYALKHDKPDEASAIVAHAGENGTVQLWAPLIGAWLDADRNKLTKPLTVKSLGIDVGRALPLANYHLALINAHAGFEEEAAKNFKEAVEDPRDPPTRIMKLLLKFYEENGQPEILTPLVTSYRAIHPGPDDFADTPPMATAQDGVAEVLYTMGGIMFGAGVVNDAAIYLGLAVYMKPGFPEATLALGDAYSELQQYARSNETYAQIAPQNRLYGRAQLHIAVNDDRLGKPKDAFALLDVMAKQSPDDPDALVTKGDLLRIHSHYAEAIAAYSEALKRIPELNSTHWPVLFARGSCLERIGKWTLAEQDLKRALELRPDQPDVLNYLAYGWLEHGQHLSDARSMLEKAVKERPDDPQIVDSMGWVLYLSGDYPGATEYLEKAVELLPGDPTVNDHLGDVYWRLGRKTEARFQWERSLTFSPEAKQADDIHKKLKEGLPPTTLAGAPATDDTATP